MVRRTAVSVGRSGREERGRSFRRPASRMAGPLRPSIRLGRIAGIEIGANWTWLIVVALIVWSLAAQVFPAQNPGLGGVTYAAMGAAAGILFFGSLVMHELGHAVVARREGMEIDGVTLWVFGGVAWFKGMFPSAAAELRIAVAGPLVTALIAGLLIGISAVVSLPVTVDGVLSWVGEMNLILLVFNLIPALPLDGGRVLRAILWKVTADFVRATRIAGALGTGFGQIMVLGGIVLLCVAGAPGGLWLALLGWILVGAATAETQLATARQALAGLHVADAMTAHPITVAASATLAQFMQGLFAGRRHAAYPVLDDDGQPVGLLSFRSAARVPSADWDRVRIAEAATPIADSVVLEENAPLEEALLDLAGGDVRALVVRDGALTGILATQDLARMIELCRATSAGLPPGRSPAARQ